MQVAHGETFLLPDQFEYEGRIDFNQTTDIYPLDVPYSQRDERFISEQYQVVADGDKLACDNGVSVSPVSTATLEDTPLLGQNCVNNLQLRGELLKVSSYLYKLAPDRVVVHNDSVTSRLQRRLLEGLESKAFVAFDVEKLIDRYGQLRALLPNLSPTVRANAANNHVLAALVGVMNVRVTCESIPDLALLTRCVQDMANMDAVNPYAGLQEQAVRADFSAACALHTALVRSPSSIRRALCAGVTVMTVGGVSGIRSIRSAYRSTPREIRSTIALPNVLLMISSPKSIDNNASADSTYAAGTTVLTSAVMTFGVSDITMAVKEAHTCGMAVAGVTANVSALLDGTVRASVMQIALSSSNVRNVSTPMTIVLLDLDSYLAAEEGLARNVVFHRIRTAVAAIQSQSNLSITLSADVSNHLLGTNQVLLTRVIGARPSIGDDGSVVGRQFYVDDGIYGSLCSRTKSSSVTAAFSVGYDQECPLPYIMKHDERMTLETSADAGFESLACTVWGQTCDSLDKVMVAAPGCIPSELNLGDWLSFTVPMCAGNGTDTGFNGYDAPMTRFMVHTGFE